MRRKLLLSRKKTCKLLFNLSLCEVGSESLTQNKKCTNKKYEDVFGGRRHHHLNNRHVCCSLGESCVGVLCDGLPVGGSGSPPGAAC